MRKNQRWASSSTSLVPFPTSYAYPDQDANGRGVAPGMQADPSQSRYSRERSDARLMGGFMALKMELRQVEGASAASLRLLTPSLPDLRNIDALTLLYPFLEVVRSPDTSGPITATALSSIDKFLTYSILHSDSPSLALAMSQISTAGTHCKFEASDSVSDEVVLLKILDVLRNCLTGRLGEVLSDESVCEMMETGLSMCCQMRLSGTSPRAPLVVALITFRRQRCSAAQLSARCKR